MTTAATNANTITAPHAPTHGADFASALVQRKPAALVAAALLTIAFVALFWSFIDRQLGIGLSLAGLDWRPGFSWSMPEDWGHSYLVPLISAYHIWLHREKWNNLKLAVFWPGLMPLLLGVLCFFYFATVYTNHMFQGAAFVLTLSGLCILLFGPRAFHLLFFPIAFLLLGVTISEAVMIKITFTLQQLAAVGSWILLNVLTIDTDLHGNTLRVFTANGDMIPLNVAEACSGMRMVIAFVALSVAVAFFGVPHWWQRIAVIMLAIPVALLMNVVRVAVLGVLSLINPELAAGDAHMIIGMILLFPSFLLFMGCVWALRNMVSNLPEGQTQ